MKKIFKNILALSCAGVMVFGLSSCFQEEQKSLTAYELAVENGFQGTEKEWLASLKGSDGDDGKDADMQEIYEAAKANGFTGTFLDFLKEYFSVEVSEGNDTKTIAKNMMSVVSVYCGFTKTTKISGGYWGTTQNKTETYSSAGSGVIIDLDKTNGNALIVTNYHVIYDKNSDASDGISDEIYLYMHGALNMFSTADGKDETGEFMKATFVGGAMDYDIAVLSVSGQTERLAQAEEAAIGNSDDLLIGEKVFAIGNPEGAGISVTSGIVSVDSEYITMSASDNSARTVQYRVIRTDAPINHGNSGGALFNASGKLIGITNAKNADDEVDNIGYALPIAQVQCITENILENGSYAMRAMLGVEVTLSDSTAIIDEHGKMVVTEKFYVSKAASSDSDASYNKLQFGDEFISFTKDGVTTQLTRRYQLNDLLLTVRKGDEIKIKVLRGKEEVDVTILYDQDSYFVKYA